MAMFAIYAPISEAQIRKEAADAIPQIEEWFKNNPQREVCNSEFWYGRQKPVRKGHVAEDVNAEMEAVLVKDKEKNKNKNKRK